jgi:predicted dehydrogenase
MKKNRREFIQNSIKGTVGIALGGIGFSSKSYGFIIGANERINIATIGIRGRGGGHINTVCSLKNINNVRLKTICDVDEQVLDGRLKTIQDKYNEKPVKEWDMRKVFDDKDIDAVVFATPNHWHALGTVWACQAGKHVYIEKPVSHNISEGRKMIEAARKYGVRVQSGFNMRSGYNIIKAIKFLHDGGIGDVYMARGLCIKPRDSFGIAKDSDPPASLHYDMWLGPAQWRRYNEKRGHYNWHWFWDTGNGDTGNQGPHQFDIARWGLNKNEHPVSIYSTGDVYGINPKECAQETPNTQSSLFKYSDGKMLEFETRGRYSNTESSLNIRIGNIFYGTEGYMEIGTNESWRAFREREKEPFLEMNIKKPGDNCHINHMKNFIDAIRFGKDESLQCDIREGHYSSTLSHLANLSYRFKRDLKFMGNYEKFVNDPEADAMLTRNYRKPYVVPEEV